MGKFYTTTINVDGETGEIITNKIRIKYLEKIHQEIKYKQDGHITNRVITKVWATPKQQTLF